MLQQLTCHKPWSEHVPTYMSSWWWIHEGSKRLRGRARLEFRTELELCSRVVVRQPEHGWKSFRNSIRVAQEATWFWIGNDRPVFPVVARQPSGSLVPQSVHLREQANHPRSQGPSAQSATPENSELDRDRLVMGGQSEMGTRKNRTGVTKNGPREIAVWCPHRARSPGAATR